MAFAERRPRMGAVLALAALLAVAGCYEDDDETLPSSSQTQQENEEISDNWLEVLDDETPVAFMVRATGEPRDDIVPLLEQAARRYRESPRMIANRVVQLWAEIRQRDGVEITVTSLLERLNEGESAPHGGSLGSVVQYYRVSRLQGADHDSALAAAMSRKAPE